MDVGSFGRRSASTDTLACCQSGTRASAHLDWLIDDRINVESVPIDVLLSICIFHETGLVRWGSAVGGV